MKDTTDETLDPRLPRKLTDSEIDNMLDINGFIDKDVPPQEWLIDGILPAETIGLVTGASNVGKGFWSLQLAVAVATGTKAFGSLSWDTKKPGAVLALWAEERKASLISRFNAIASCENSIALYGAPGSEFSPIDIALVEKNLAAVSLVGEADVRIAKKINHTTVRTQYFDEIIEYGKTQEERSGKKLRLIIIDPISRFWGGGETNTTDIIRFVRCLESIQQAFNKATVLAVYRTPENEVSQADTVDLDLCEHSKVLADALGFHLHLQTMRPIEANEYGISELEAYNYVKMAVIKNNYAPKTRHAIWLYRQSGGALRKCELTK